MTITLCDVSRERAESTPDRGYTFLSDGVNPSDSLTYFELDRRCQAIATALQAAGAKPGSRALLVYAPGLEFIEAFWSCAYAGLIAVPAPPPQRTRLQRTIPRLRAIALDCKPDIVMTHGEVAKDGELYRWIPELAAATTIDMSQVKRYPAAWSRPSIDDRMVAVIQYTSGSTSTPRGVTITHQNFLHNLEMLKSFHGGDEAAVMVHWLPLFHDMGLIRGMMSPLHMGADCVMMPPLRFVERPRRWLAAASRYKATIVGAPNFGYELCNLKIDDDELDSLDLSNVRVAFCSAEPIRASTIRRFARKFAVCGFSGTALRPSYGLAEATVIVCGEVGGSGPDIRPCDSRALRTNRFVEVSPDDESGVEVVACGRALGGQDVVIVRSGRPAGPDEIGEIWIRGASVADGYWQNAVASRTVFGRRLTDGQGPFLDSGDLGWLSPTGQLFVMGRKKDVLIIRGQNYYPHDIESAIESEVPSVRRGCSAALSVDDGVGQVIAVVCEVKPLDETPLDWTTLVSLVRRAVSEGFQLAVGVVAFIESGTIWKTASGKLQRSRMRSALIEGELRTLYLWKRAVPSIDPTSELGRLGKSFRIDGKEPHSADRDGGSPVVADRRLPDLSLTAASDGPSDRPQHS